MCGAAVPINMRMGRLVDAGTAAGGITGHANRLALHRLVRAHSRRKQPVFGLAPTPVDSQMLQQSRRESNITWNAALALPYVDHHALAIDIANLEVAKLIATQTRGIEGGDDGPVFQIGGVIENLLYFFRAEHGWDLRLFPGPGYALVEP